MTRNHRLEPEWRQFEQLVARIEQDADRLGVVIKSPDRIRCLVTNRMREVDASIRTRDGELITLECRRRRGTQDVTWIEQLATKRRSLGASKTIAASASAFSANAYALALKNSIELKTLSELERDQLNPLLDLSLVVFWHRRVELKSVGLWKARGDSLALPNEGEVDLTLPTDTDLFAPLFRNTDEGHRWSINDVWHQLQDAANPYASLPKMIPAVLSNAYFPYPGNVTADTPSGEVRLGGVVLSIALWWESEAIWQSAATMVSYGSRDQVGLQRLEFSSALSDEEWAVSVQAPPDASEIKNLQPGGVWPDQSGSASTGPRARPIDFAKRTISE